MTRNEYLNILAREIETLKKHVASGKFSGGKLAKIKDDLRDTELEYGKLNDIQQDLLSNISESYRTELINEFNLISGYDMTEETTMTAQELKDQIAELHWELKSGAYAGEDEATMNRLTSLLADLEAEYYELTNNK